MARKSRKSVGVIGLGIIGSRVAAGLRAGGFHVYVWNRSPKSEPNFLGSAAEIAEVADTIQLFVPDAEALFETIDSFREKLTPEHTIICNATVGPEAVLDAARLVTDTGAKFLDAPFTGSKGAAENRQLVYYIGGEEDVFKKVEPVLKATSKSIVRIGGIGQAAAVKVATNMIAAVTVQTLAEALAIVRRSGITPEIFAKAMEENGARSTVLDMKLAKMAASDYDPHFSLKHMFKDVQLAIHVANGMELDIPATTATAGVMYGGLNRGWADLDFAALAKVYEELTPMEALEDVEWETVEENAVPMPEVPTAPPDVVAEIRAVHTPDEVPSAEAPAVPHKETLSHMTPPPREVLQNPPEPPEALATEEPPPVSEKEPFPAAEIPPPPEETPAAPVTPTPPAPEIPPAPAPAPVPAPAEREAKEDEKTPDVNPPADPVAKTTDDGTEPRDLPKENKVSMDGKSEPKPRQKFNIIRVLFGPPRKR